MNGYRRIYYDKENGNKIAEIAFDKNFIPETVEQDITKYNVLSERNRDTFDVLELEYGDYINDFREGTLIGVDLETLTPIFSYPNPENPDEPIIPEMPLSEKIALLEERDAGIQEDLNFIYEILGG